MNGSHSNPVMMIQDSSLSSSSSRPQQKTCVSLSLPCKCICWNFTIFVYTNNSSSLDDSAKSCWLLTRLFFAYILSSFFLSLPFVLIYNSFFILHFVRQNHPCRLEFVKTKHFGRRKQFYFENLIENLRKAKKTQSFLSKPHNFRIYWEIHKSVFAF